jgi:hypothetical protein
MSEEAVQDAYEQGIRKPSLALLGGFSGNTLYRSLERLVQSIESVVCGDEHNVVFAERQAAQTEAELKALEQRLTFMALLIGLRQQLDAYKSLTEIMSQLDETLPNLGNEQPLPTAPHGP